MIDERLKLYLNKIRSEIFVLMYLIIAVSFIVKNLFLGLGFENTITEFIILLIVPIYTYIRALTLKLSMADFYTGEKKYITGTIISCLVACGVYIAILFKNSKFSESESIISVIGFVVAFIFARFIIFKVFKKQKERNDKFYE